VIKQQLLEFDSGLWYTIVKYTRVKDSPMAW